MKIFDLFLTFGFIALAGFIFFYLSEKNEPSIEEGHRFQNLVTTSSAVESMNHTLGSISIDPTQRKEEVGIGEIHSKEERLTAQGLEEIKLPSMPSLQKIRTEVDEDPHGTPPSILEFALGLAGAMERALSEQRDAPKVFDYMSSCATQSEKEVTDSLQVICASNAFRLSEKYPELFRHRYDEMISKLSPRTKEILDAVQY